MSKSKCVGDSRGADTSMRNNLREHAKSYDNSPSQDKILKSNFLFSLTPQKHSVGETMSATARSFSFKVQNATKAHGPQVDKNSKNMDENLVNANQGENKKEVVVIDIPSDEQVSPNPSKKRRLTKHDEKEKQSSPIFVVVSSDDDKSPYLKQNFPLRFKRSVKKKMFLKPRNQKVYFHSLTKKRTRIQQILKKLMNYLRANTHSDASVKPNDSDA